MFDESSLENGDLRAIGHDDLEAAREAAIVYFAAEATADALGWSGDGLAPVKRAKGQFLDALHSAGLLLSWEEWMRDSHSRPLSDTDFPPADRSFGDDTYDAYDEYVEDLLRDWGMKLQAEAEQLIRGNVTKLRRNGFKIVHFDGLDGINEAVLSLADVESDVRTHFGLEPDAYIGDEWQERILGCEREVEQKRPTLADFPTEASLPVCVLPDPESGLFTGDQNSAIYCVPNELYDEFLRRVGIICGVDSEDEEE